MLTDSLADWWICCTDGQVVMDHLMDWQGWCTDGQTLTDGLTDCAHDIQMCQRTDGPHDLLYRWSGGDGSSDGLAKMVYRWSDIDRWSDRLCT